MNQNALYYPYTHIRDVNWLKATLLLFSEVRRMMPYQYTPDDSLEVQAFAQFPLKTFLSVANIWTPRAIAAQEDLANKLLADAQNAAFRSKYGRFATRQALKSNDRGFQIHQRKLSKPLKNALRSTELAWVPDSPEPYDIDAEYVELHPRVGEAVMSTLAIAAATGESLDIVGDSRSGHLHECLLEQKADEIYNAWLHPPALPAAPKKPEGEDLFEFLVGFACNISAVTPDALAALDREPLRKLIAQLRVLASEMPAMDPGAEREKYFRDVASKVLNDWGSDRSNLASYWGQFFGKGLADTSKKFVEKVAENLTSGVEKAATGGLAGAAAAAIGGGAAPAIMTPARESGWRLASSTTVWTRISGWSVPRRTVRIAISRF
jgi:hypothetical protein